MVVMIMMGDFDSDCGDGDHYDVGGGRDDSGDDVVVMVVKVMEVDSMV